MRITNNMIVSQQLGGIQLNMAALQKAQEQLTLGKRLTAASDDPTAATQIMGSASSLRSLDQYRTNVQRATSRVSLEDSVLSQISDLVARAKQLGVAQGSDTATAATRATANAEVGQIFQQIVSLANTKFGNEYLFGGDQSLTAPFAATGTAGATLDYTTTGSTGERGVAVADGKAMAATHDGQTIFKGTGLLDAVRDLSRALDPSSPSYGKTGIADAMSKLDGAFDSVQTLIGDTGARANALDSASQNLDALKSNITSFKSGIEEVDLESAMTELTSRQLAYQAALVATSKLSSLNLTDYLR